MSSSIKQKSILVHINNIILLILIELDCALVVVVSLKDDFIIINCVFLIVSCASIELD